MVMPCICPTTYILQGGVSLHFHHFLYFIESSFNLFMTLTPVCKLKSCFIVFTTFNEILLKFFV